MKSMRLAPYATVLGAILLVATIASSANVGNAPAIVSTDGKAAPPGNFPTIPAKHPHVRALLENSMRYVSPENHLIDPRSGYPVEGWNDQPEKGLGLRHFTQLTAIGQWLEVLANAVAGNADTPALPRQQALAQLELAVHTLHHDQQDPRLAAQGLLVNFLDLSSGERLAPLVNDVDRSMFLGALGPQKGEALWQALKTKGWIVPQGDGSQASIRRVRRLRAQFLQRTAGPLDRQGRQGQDHGDPRPPGHHRGLRRQRQSFHLCRPHRGGR